MLKRRIDDIVAVNQTHPHSPNRSIVGRNAKRNIGDGQRRAGANDGQDIRLMDAIYRKHSDDDLNFIAQIFGEKGTQRAISQATGQNRALAGTTFTPKKRSGDAPGSV